MSRRACIVLTAAAALTALATPVLAGGGGEQKQLSAMFIAAHAFNLIVVIFLIVKFAGKPIQRALAGRADAVTQEIDAAAKLHAEAQSMLDTYEQKLAGLDAEIDALKTRFRTEGEAEKQKLIEQGEAEAARIRAEAERTARNEIARARARLEDEVIDRAIEAATAAIKTRLTAADHRRLTAEYLSRVEESGNA